MIRGIHVCYGYIRTNTKERSSMMKKDELAVLSQAILNEVEGYEFYTMAASNSKGESKDAFLQVAEEEKKHAEYLRDLSDKLTNSDEEKLQFAYELNPPSPEIYKWEKLDVKEASLAMTVFSIGMQMEKDAIKFYTEARDKTEVDELREIYQILIKWEEVHLNEFTQQYNVYKNEWWAEQNFAPF